MLGICPNKKHPDWQYAVDKLGKEVTLTAYDFFGGRIPTEKEVNAMERGATLNAYNNQSVWDIEAAENLIERWRTVEGRSEPVKRRFTDNRLLNRLATLNKKYGKAFTFEKGNANNKGITIRVTDNSVISEGLQELHITRNQQRADLAAEEAAMNKEAQIRIDEEGNVMPMESRKLPSIPTESETRSEAERKIDIFRKSVPLVEHIIWDETQATIAMVEAGGKTIRINPTLLQTDTVGHEFGHILIDIAGGMNSAFIKLGRAQLNGTAIEQAVIAKYPDLVSRNDDRIDKEILATAVGMEVAKIFKEEAEQNKFIRWAIRFFRKIRSILGIEQSVARQLAERLVSGKPLQTKENASTEEKRSGLYVQGRPAYYAQHSKNLNDMLSIMDKMVMAEEKLRDDARTVLQRKADLLSKKGTNVKALEEVEVIIPRMESSSPTKALIQMIRYAYKAAQDMDDKYKAAMTRMQGETDANKRRVLTAKTLSEWNNNMAAYDIVEEMSTLFASTKRQIEMAGTDSDTKALSRLWNENKELVQAIVGEEAYKAGIKKGANLFDMLDPMLKYVLEVKALVEKLYEEKGKELAVDFLLPHSKHAEIKRRAMYEKEWLGLSKTEQAENPRDAYIHNKIRENWTDIMEESRKLLMEELNMANKDVGFFTRFADTLLDSRDVIGSSLAKAVFDITEDTRRQTLEWKYRFADQIKALETQLGRSMTDADETFFAFMLETDDKGRLTQNIVSNVHSKLASDFKEFKDLVYSDTYKDNDGRKPSQSEKNQIVAKWIEKNAPEDKEGKYEARKAFAEQMRKNKYISEEELKRYLRSIKVTTKSARTPVNEIFKESKALDMIYTFERINRWNNRDVSKEYKDMNSKWYELERIREAGLRNGVQTDERIKFYDFILEARDAAALRLPSKYARTTELPSMMKSLGQRMKSAEVHGMSRVDIIKQELKAKFQRNQQDTEYGLLADEKAMEAKSEEDGAVEKTATVNEAGDPVYFLPVYYVNKINAEEQNFDVATIYFNYLKMAINFANKYEVLAEIEMINYFANKRESVTRDGKGKIVTDSTKKKVFGDSKTLREKALGTKNTMLAAQIDDFVKMNVYDMMREEEKDLHILGLEINQSKLLDNINKYTALNLLGLNFVAGFANITMGEMMQLEEAFAGQYTSLKSLHKATKVYYSNFGGILGDIGARRPTNLINLLNEKFDVLHDSDESRLNHGTKFAAMMNTNTLFFTSHAGEHYMQTRFMMSMLEDMRAFNDAGEDVGSMLDNLYVDEKTKTVKVKEGVVNFDEQAQNDFAARMHRVLSAMHGEYAKIGQSAAQRFALFRMAILFRKFVIPGFKRRWQKKGINNLLNDETEGFYQTFGRFAKTFIKDLAQLKFDLMKEDFGKMTKLERANMVRMLSEISFFTVSVVMCMAAMQAKSNADDKDNFWINNLAYQALRLRSELMFYVNPMATMQILQSPMAAISVAENVSKLIGQMAYPIYSGTFTFDVYDAGSWKGKLKVEKTLTQLVPVYKQIPRMMNMGDLLSRFQQ
jgi:hypothetical protein